jgi:hypothetical protein
VLNEIDGNGSRFGFGADCDLAELHGVNVPGVLVVCLKYIYTVRVYNGYRTRQR